LRFHGFDAAAGAGATLRTKIKERAHFGERKTEFPRAMNEPEPTDIGGTIRAVPATALRFGNDADPFVVADCLDMAASPSGQLADQNEYFRHLCALILSL
jgi:hypothetical protein